MSSKNKLQKLEKFIGNLKDLNNSRKTVKENKQKRLEKKYRKKQPTEISLLIFCNYLLSL
jgi:hypothetical protein